MFNFWHAYYKVYFAATLYAFGSFCVQAGQLKLGDWIKTDEGSYTCGDFAIKLFVDSRDTFGHQKELRLGCYFSRALSNLDMSRKRPYLSIFLDQQ